MTDPNIFQMLSEIYYLLKKRLFYSWSLSKLMPLKDPEKKWKVYLSSKCLFYNDT